VSFFARTVPRPARTPSVIGETLKLFGFRLRWAFSRSKAPNRGWRNRAARHAENVLIARRGRFGAAQRFPLRGTVFRSAVTKVKVETL